MKIHASLIFMFILSFLALHQCAKMNVKGIEDSNIVITSNCVKGVCSRIFVRDCWCCPGLTRKCWEDKASCDAICPRPHLPPK
ncbi:hypothetical protein Bca4012_009453 [Brassica carinata]|uniref:Embryo surrounding factor 1 brassicaceae domain-containing protein n=1 Tax=Brassica carinata TaxID=52824 RepID=A0A8X7S1U0_BRACI|nr:hypothetical protein Bca52824_034724 [Brassica carinata]